MVLVKSISGIRGTLENVPGQSLSNEDIVKIVLSYIKEVVNISSQNTVIIGRDARPSGKRINKLIVKILLQNGVNVIDLGLATTPTIGIYVKNHSASGGIIVSASHNTIEWNALKLLNNEGEFLNKEIAEKIINSNNKNYNVVKKQGEYRFEERALQEHIDKILALDIVNINSIKSQHYNVIVDGINSVGGIAVPKLLNKLGVKNIYQLNCNPNGAFAHNPEPLPENIMQIRNIMQKQNYDFGIVVDPDVDRLCFLDNTGTPVGEEYTLVLAAKHVLEKQNKKTTCSNLSSTMALRKITESLGGQYCASAVGEINVVEKMKQCNAVIGGEGNGGVIYPETHYGRDALVGIAIILSLLSENNISLLQIKKQMPQYFISKNKVIFDKDFELIVNKLKKEYVHYNIITIDGIKAERDEEWFHVRKSNTEPVVRIYAEAASLDAAGLLAKEVLDKIKTI